MIFAGAGVSMGPPANYPDFNGLARKIARGTNHRIARPEPIDHFLGRLEAQNVKVQQLTRNLLTNPESKPNPLHSSLIKLFASDSTVRLVTTNFDAHFSTEVKRILGTKPKTFYAPALPVGDDRFQGLVYIHGSVDTSERLVLTDGDFGRAYLTEGWARRFLLGLYSKFVVLFVGYSHKDIVMRYIARGLAPSSQRRLFALTPEGNDSHWEFLDISPISYPLRDKPDKHSALREAVDAWAELASMRAFQHEGRIKSILSSSPPLVGSEEDDYMRSAVEDKERHHFFARNATGTEWLLWAEERRLLAPLFSRRTDMGRRCWTLADWFAREYVVKTPEQALGVFERQGQVLSHYLWHHIASNFNASENIDAGSLTKWLPVLLDQATPEDNPDLYLLENLFTKAAGTGSWSLLLLLFEHLTRPRVQFEKNISVFDKGPKDKVPARGKVRIPGSHYWLNEALTKFLKPNMADVAEELARITAHSIRTAHNLASLLGRANREGDSMSFGRSAIEPHPQDDLNHDFDIVIDACRDSLEWLLRHKRRVARNHIEEWIESPTPLLRRIAVHGMRVDRRASSGQKLRWVVKHELQASRAVHHEMFQLLKNAYPTAGKAEKKAFLDKARAATLLKIKTHPDSDEAMYWHSLFRLLSWLDEATEHRCRSIRGRLRRLQNRYPSFRLSDHPDFTYWSSGVRVGTESPIGVDDLQKKPIKNAVRFLVTYKGDDSFGPDREGLLDLLLKVVARDPDWSLRIARELLKRSRRNDDIWKQILRGWTEADLTDKNWHAILSMVDRNRKLTAYVYSVTQLLERGVRKEKHRLPYSLLPLAERTGRRSWAVAIRDEEQGETASTDWLQTGIHETGGNLAQFFITAVSIRRKHAGTRWRGIPNGLKTQLQKIVTGKSYTAEMGRVLLASQMHFLYLSDSSWTRKHIIPLLSWQRGKKQAVQAWHGYLGRGKWHDDLLPDLFPLYEKSFARLDTELQHGRGRFVTHVASIWMLGTRRRDQGVWLRRFLQSVSPVDRKEFAVAICRILWSLAPDKAAYAWRKRLNSYWLKRISGKPVPLDPDEASAMAEWAPHLGPVFPQVVQRIKETGLDLSVDRFIYHILTEKQIPETHPKATAELLSSLVPSSYEPVHDYGKLPKILDVLVKHPETHDLLAPVIDHMAAKGSLIAGKYRGLISP